MCLFHLGKKAAFLIWEKSEVNPKLHPAKHHFHDFAADQDLGLRRSLLVQWVNLRPWIKSNYDQIFD